MYNKETKTNPTMTAYQWNNKGNVNVKALGFLILMHSCFE